MDLAKAFDTIDVKMAEAATQWVGTPVQASLSMSATWRAGRRCSVEGELSKKIKPSRGLPPGDPLSPAALGMVIAPWHKIIRGLPGGAVVDFAYMDDRSLKVTGSGEGGQQKLQYSEVLERELEATAEFDAAADLSENVKKRQRWMGS